MSKTEVCEVAEIPSDGKTVEITCVICGRKIATADPGRVWCDWKCLLVEVERLQAVIAKLPKCWRLNDEGKLVQDVPVVPGMKIFTVSQPFRRITEGYASCKSYKNCCNTREAADAVKAARAAGSGADESSI